MTNKSRTLKEASVLQLLTYIIKHNNNLTPSSHIWKRLAEKIKYVIGFEKTFEGAIETCNTYIYRHTKNPKNLVQLRPCISIDSIKNRILTCSNIKYTSYYYNEINTILTKEYVTEKYFNHQKLIGRIVKFEEDQEWYHKNLWVWVNDDTIGSPQRTQRLVPLPYMELHYEACACCRKTVKKNVLKYHPKLELKVCTKCYSQVQISNESLHIDNIVTGYHNRKTSWRFLINNPEQSLPMGIEIEIQPRDNIRNNSQMLVDIYNHQKVKNPDWHEFYAERDGSLDNNGIEIVTNPMSLKFATEYWKEMLPIFRREYTGWNTYKLGIQNSYGIHITMSRKYWTDFQIARFTKFLYAKENEKFLFIIAQRDYIYNGAKLGSHTKQHNRVISFNMVNHGKLYKSATRYQALALKDSKLVECRIFASTLYHTSFMKNYEFIDAMWHWIKTTPFSYNYIDFLQWLCSKPEHYKKYTNLFTFLNKDTFFFKSQGINGSSMQKIDNTFKPYLKTKVMFEFQPKVDLDGDDDYVSNN